MNLAEAFLRWSQSPEGRLCLDVSTLRNEAQGTAGHILRGRLEAAFRAGHCHAQIGDADLREALSEFAAQHRCGCGHPHCHACWRDALAQRALGNT